MKQIFLANVATAAKPDCGRAERSTLTNAQQFTSFKRRGPAWRQFAVRAATNAPLKKEFQYALHGKEASANARRRSTRHHGQSQSFLWEVRDAQIETDYEESGAVTTGYLVTKSDYNVTPVAFVEGTGKAARKLAAEIACNHRLAPRGEDLRKDVPLPDHVTQRFLVPLDSRFRRLASLPDRKGFVMGMFIPGSECSGIRCPAGFKVPSSGESSGPQGVRNGDVHSWGRMQRHSLRLCAFQKRRRSQRSFGLGSVETARPGSAGCGMNRTRKATMYSADVLLFNVGPWVYAAHVGLKDPIVEGKRSVGAIDRTARTISIAPDLCFSARVETLFHELAHAWLYAVSVTTREGQCDLWAAMTASAIQDIERQGGMLAIANMKPCDPLKFKERAAWWPWRVLDREDAPATR